MESVFPTQSDGSCLGICVVQETGNGERNGAADCGSASAICDYGSEIDDCPEDFVTDGKRGNESENVSTNSSVSLHSVCGYYRAVYASRYASVDGPLRVWSSSLARWLRRTRFPQDRV